MFRSFLPIAICIGFACQIVLVAAAQAQVVVRQPAGGAAQMQYYNPLGQSLQWALYPQMQKELDIVPEQKTELEKIQKEAMAKTQELYKLLSERDPKIDQAERYAKYNEQAKVLGEETEEKVGKILLPHQKKRLSQIVLQMKLAQTGYGSAAALGGEEIAKELGITDAQKEELQKMEAEVRQETQKKYQEFYKKLNDEAREKLMSVLTPAQRKKLEELTGQKFEWQLQAQPAQPASGGSAPLKRDEKQGD